MAKPQLPAARNQLLQDDHAAQLQASAPPASRNSPGSNLRPSASEPGQPPVEPATRHPLYVPPRSGEPAHRLPVVAPNAWRGELGCVIGPFSCRPVANYFTSQWTDFGQYEIYRFTVFAKRDSWYVEVEASL